MNKKICAILFSILSFSSTFAHGTLVHQHMVREAYKLLKHYVGQDIYKMKDHIGYNQEGTAPFTPGGLVVIGAYREDYEDLTNEGQYWPNQTMTHFWDPDFSDDQGGLTWNGYEYSNALEKAIKYYGGSWIEISGAGNRYRYQSLSQFYKDGITQQSINYSSNYNTITVSIEQRDQIVWEILGRMCHLLGDMTIPAHTHNDPHPPGDLDTYEEWMNYGPVYNTWTVNDAIAQGGLINPTSSSNPLKFLFYPTAQITNFFNTFDVDGNNGSGVNDPFSLYPGLTEKITELTNFYGGTAPTKNYVVALDYCANQTFVLGIRSIAGLLSEQKH